MGKKIRFFNTNYQLDYWLLLITPIIDTINGLYIQKYGATGLSIGTIYRLLFMLYVIARICKKKMLFIRFLPLLYFPVIGIIRGASGGGLFGCITYAMKWLLPLILIIYYGLAKNNKQDIKRCLIRCLEFWSAFVPLSLIVEYLLQVGEVSYYDAGFKGLYYSTNDIALVLIVLYIYTLYKTININRKYIIMCVLNLLAIIILSTKSSLIFAAISVVYMLLKSNKIKFRHMIPAMVLTAIVGIITITLMRSHLEGFWNRYANMWNNINGNNLIARLLVFATSGRTERIQEFFAKISEDGIFATNLLFGWIYPDNAHVIEMDWHDLICQYGVIGFAICFYEYATLLIKCKVNSEPYWYAVIVCFIYSILAGHVISGAFSGTAMALVFALLIIESSELKKKKK